MRDIKNKILLIALILGIPTVTTLIKSEESNAMLRTAGNSVKTMASMINKTTLIKPPVAPKPSNVKVVNGGLVKNTASLFNNTTTATNKVSTVKRTHSVGKLNLQTTFANNLDSLLGANHGTGTGLKKSNSLSVNKLDSSKQTKLNSLLGGSSSSKGYSLDLSKLPETPPPPPTSTQSQGTPISNSQQLLTNTTTVTTTPPPIPDAPPLPPPKLSSTNTTTNGGAGNLKNKLSSKLSTGLNKTNTNTQTQKPNNPQDDLLKELKTKLQLRTK